MKGKGKYLVLAAVALALLGVHVLFSLQYRGTMLYEKLHPTNQFYVFNETGYDLLSAGMKDEASRLFLLYAVYTSANMNIPGTNFNRLTTSLNGISHLDTKNIQPYLTVAYYWSWSKKPDHRKLMTDYMLTGVDRFPENWDIPYTVFRFMRENVAEEDLDEETSRIALDYLRIAAERAATYGGPKWIVDYPAILMNREGEALEAAYWLLETYQKTDNVQQKEIIEERFMEILKELPVEQAEMLHQQIQSISGNNG